MPAYIMNRHSGIRERTAKMSKPKVLLKAFTISMKIKGPLSILISLIGFATAFLPVLLAQQLRHLTDELQYLAGSNGNAKNALSAFAIVIILYVTQIIITNLNQYTNEMNTVKISRYLKKTLLSYKCNIRYKYIENHDDFVKKLNFVEEYAGFEMARSVNSMITILQHMLSFILAAIALWKVSPLIVIILIITSVPAAILSYKQQDETFRSRAKWMEEGAMVIYYCNLIGGNRHVENAQQEIRHFSLFNYLKSCWRATADSYIAKKNKMMSKHVKYNAAADFLRSIIYLIILLITAYEIYMNPAIGLGVFTLVYTLSGQLQTVTGDFLVGVMVLAQNIPYMQEYFYLDTLEREPDTSTSSVKDGEINIHNVTFAYPGTEKNVLHNINLTIKNGEKIAVVGENGSGKSTFISLICGMFEPADGSIEVGGINVSSDPVAARDAISVVFQDFAHYEASLRDNITVSDKHRNASDKEIIELLKRINVADIVEAQPNGLSELVGSFSDKANNLSGGQWQKISLARAAYRQNTHIMILDEPTSALDPVAEAQLYRDFTSLTGDKTTLLISHRLGITSIVDRILVFDAGRIVEDGTHAELMHKNGLYAKMYRAQAKWYN